MVLMEIKVYLPFQRPHKQDFWMEDLNGDNLSLLKIWKQYISNQLIPDPGVNEVYAENKSGFYKAGRKK